LVLKRFITDIMAGSLLATAVETLSQTISAPDTENEMVDKALELLLALADRILRRRDEAAPAAQAVVIEGLCRAIEQNIGGDVELALAAPLELFADMSGNMHNTLFIALYGNLTFLGNRRFPPELENSENSFTLRATLREHAAPQLRALLTCRTPDITRKVLVPLLHLSDKDMFARLLHADTDGMVAIATMLGSPDVSDRQRVAQALRGCIDRLLLGSLELGELPPRTNHMHNFAPMVGNALDSDLTFRVNGRNLPAHRMMLRASGVTDVFRAMFTHDAGATPGAIVEITETTFEAFELLLHYLYTGEIRASAELVDEYVANLSSCDGGSDGDELSFLEQLAALAKRYMIHRLQLEVVRLMSEPLLQLPAPTSSRDPPRTTLLNVAWHNLTLATETTFTSAAAPRMLEDVAARFVLEHLEQAVATPYYGDGEAREAMTALLVTHLAKLT
jgi:hypothetical protein